MKYYAQGTSAIPRQAGFFKFNFRNDISQNTGKCELGGFSFRQSQLRSATIKNSTR